MSRVKSYGLNWQGNHFSIVNGRAAETGWSYRAVRGKSCCITGLGAKVGVTGEAGQDRKAGHRTTCGAGGRQPSDKCGCAVL